MGSRTKKQKQLEEDIKAKIVAGHRRGVCDAYGRTVKTTGGRPVAMPRFRYGSVIKTWRYSKELGRCVRVV